MLSKLIPADIHQHRRIQSIAGIPWRSGGMGALSFESELSGNERILAQAIDGAELLADVIVQRHIDIFEIAIADKIRPAD